MAPPGIRRYLMVAVGLFTFLALWHRMGSNFTVRLDAYKHNQFTWRRVKYQYPVESFRPLPTGARTSIPKVQADFGSETPEEESTRLTRQRTIKNAFLRSWAAYKEHAWLHDELAPVSSRKKDSFGGWGVTLVDSLDTLWLMDLKDEFNKAVEALDRHVSFETTETKEVNVFETTIRFLGGLLSAFELSGDECLLAKATDVGDMLYKAFDTPNHLPVTRWDLQAAAKGESQTALSVTIIAELGSLNLEFTRLSLVSGDPKYFEAVQHISELLADSQMSTKLPGLWPVLIDAANEKFDAGLDYSIGAMADSLYECLPKMIALLGDDGGMYRDMYSKSIDAIQQHLLFRPMLPEANDILFSGIMHFDQKDGILTKTLEPSTGHLSCFAGGTLAFGGRLLSNEAHVELGDKLTRGCIWAYNSTTTKVMPEELRLTSCPGLASCEWDEERWHQGIREAQQLATSDVKAAIEKQLLPQGITEIHDGRYILRPEAIESIFVMYRITGDAYWREAAWEMWKSIDKLTHTLIANSGVWDVNYRPGEGPGMIDSMESFWTGETLKYFYLIFSDPSLVNLDEWVFSTEAHPFRRLV